TKGGSMTSDEMVPASLSDISKAVWVKHRAMTQAAIAAWWAAVEDEGLADAAREAAAVTALDAARRSANTPPYQQARALTSELSVGGRVSLSEAMTADDSGRGFVGRRPVAALRAFLSVRVRFEGRVMRPGEMQREQMLAYAERLESQ